MSNYQITKERLMQHPKVWLVTGVAGFIGSNLLEALLLMGQKVVGLDNFSTGRSRNLEEVKREVSDEQWRNFTLIEGSIENYETCVSVVRGVDYVLHQAALGSVPRSIADPIASNSANVTGFLNMLNAAKAEKVSSFTYAASSSTYGDHPALPKVEPNIGQPLSPYAVTKYVNELYAAVYSRTYGFNAVGLRYFNVFGKRQDPNGAYAAVIPKWISAMLSGQEILIYGDGNTSRDFCYIDNVVQANILAATSTSTSKGEVYNIALGDRTTLNELYELIKEVVSNKVSVVIPDVGYRDFRKGDVKHSMADISKAKHELGYSPDVRIKEGVERAVLSYMYS